MDAKIYQITLAKPGHICLWFIIICFLEKLGNMHFVGFTLHSCNFLGDNNFDIVTFIMDTFSTVNQGCAKKKKKSLVRKERKDEED